MASVSTYNSSSAPLTNQFVNDIKQIITTAQANAVRSVDYCRVQMYWHLGKRIFEEEQHIPIVLVANKWDLQSEFQVTKEEAEQNGEISEDETQTVEEQKDTENTEEQETN